MSYTSVLVKVAKGAGAGIAAITALPLFGVVGTITAAGIIVGSTIGGIAGALDEIYKG